MGIQSGSSVAKLLENIIINSEVNSYYITVSYDIITTNDLEEINSIKEKINPKNKYEVISENDENNLINKITIKDKK